MKVKYLIVALLAVAFSSCSDFLQEDPTTQLSVSEVYNSDRTADAILNGAYAQLASYNYYSYRFFYETETASGLFATLKTTQGDIGLGAMNILTTDPHNESMYQTMYKTIGVSNEILYYLGQPDNKLTPSVRKRVKGEAAFLRALNYFNLVRLYGKVSLITQPSSVASVTNLPRCSVDTVYKRIIEDLDSAYAWLPAKGSQLAGRPFNYAAKAMLAKVYLTMATNANVTSTTHENCFQYAYDNAKAVYDANVYSLEQNYANLFGAIYKGESDTILNRNGSESIFEIQYSRFATGNRTTEGTTPASLSLMPLTTSSDQRGKTRPHKEVYDSMFVINKTKKIFDPRIGATLIYDSLYSMVGDVNKIYCYPLAIGNLSLSLRKAGAKVEDFTYLKKYVDPRFTTTGSSANMIVYRYADLLLILAEAANEIGKPTTEVVGYINQVLTRARDANGDGTINPVSEIYPQNWANTLSQDKIRTDLLKARLVELLGEGDDWFTTHRRKEWLQFIVRQHNNRTAKLITGSTTEATLAKKGIYKFPSDDNAMTRNLLFPIPLTEINNNSSITENNFGY